VYTLLTACDYKQFPMVDKGTMTYLWGLQGLLSQCINIVDIDYAGV